MAEGATEEQGGEFSFWYFSFGWSLFSPKLEAGTQEDPYEPG